MQGPQRDVQRRKTGIQSLRFNVRMINPLTEQNIGGAVVFKSFLECSLVAYSSLYIIAFV